MLKYDVHCKCAYLTRSNLW